MNNLQNDINDCVKDSGTITGAAALLDWYKTYLCCRSHLGSLWHLVATDRYNSKKDSEEAQRLLQRAAAVVKTRQFMVPSSMYALVGLPVPDT